MQKFRPGLAAWAVAIAGVALCSAETIEEVEKKIVERATKHTAYQGKTKVTQNMQTPDMKYSSDGESSFDCLKQGDKWLYRSEGKSKSVTTVQGTETKQDATVLLICDGTYLFTISDTNGQKMAMKMKVPETSAMIVDKDYFATLRKDHDLKLNPDETVDGHKCWVIAAKAKQKPQEGMPETTIFWFDQDSGLVVKTVAKDSAGKTVMTSTTLDMKLGASIPADRFVFKAPEGVQVMDMTEHGGAGETQGAGQGQAAGTDKPEAAPKDDEAKSTDKPADKGKKEKLPKLPKLPG